VALWFWLGAASAFAQQTNSSLLPIDLQAALRLAGAQSLDVWIAGEQVKIAQADHEQARLRFFPWIEPAVGYRRHEGNIQDVGGSILDVSKQSYAAGASLNAKVEIGEAIYQSLAAKQLVRAAEEGLEAQRQNVTLDAAQAYFELARAKASVGVAHDAVRIAADYAAQVERAVSVGIAFKGDAHRAAARTAQARMGLRQVEEQHLAASARLVQMLRLEPTAVLDPQDADLAPLTLVKRETALDALVAQALASRPELRQSEAVGASARRHAQGATYGPLVPTLGARADFYGLGGGQSGDWGNFDDGQDYFVGLSWRIGPGGLFDGGRRRAATAREQTSQLESLRLRDEVTRQVVEAQARANSLTDQIALAQQTMASAEETLKLSQQRKEFGVGAVLETIQAEQEYARARQEYLRVLAEHNAAQFRLRAALGQPIADAQGEADTPSASSR
jgi:outer membrane protein TolC